MDYLDIIIAILLILNTVLIARLIDIQKEHGESVKMLFVVIMLLAIALVIHCRNF